MCPSRLSPTPHAPHARPPFQDWRRDLGTDWTGWKAIVWSKNARVNASDDACQQRASNQRTPNTEQQVRGNAQQNDLFVAEQVAFMAITDQRIANDRQIAASLALCARSTEVSYGIGALFQPDRLERPERAEVAATARG